MAAAQDKHAEHEAAMSHREQQLQTGVAQLAALEKKLQVNAFIMFDSCPWYVHMFVCAFQPDLIGCLSDCFLLLGS